MSYCVHQNFPLQVTRSYSEGLTGGKITFTEVESSQFLSSLLLVAPKMRRGLELRVVHDPANPLGFTSKPYVDMTVETMRKMGIGVESTLEFDEEKRVDLEGSTCAPVSQKGAQGCSYVYRIRPQSFNAPKAIKIEVDCSSATYFWALAAIVNGTKIYRSQSRPDDDLQAIYW